MNSMRSKWIFRRFKSYTFIFSFFVLTNWGAPGVSNHLSNQLVIGMPKVTLNILDLLSSLPGCPSFPWINVFK